jgi:hypothetical protein
MVTSLSGTLVKMGTAIARHELPRKMLNPCVEAVGITRRPSIPSSRLFPVMKQPAR